MNIIANLEHLDSKSRDAELLRWQNSHSDIKQEQTIKEQQQELLELRAQVERLTDAASLAVGAYRVEYRRGRMWANAHIIGLESALEETPSESLKILSDKERDEVEKEVKKQCIAIVSELDPLGVEPSIAKTCQKIVNISTKPDKGE